ncbi:protein stoned-B-like [Lineus longissimus]|uniref:protein stoned-B-like n=1 Tax=Lineus longissimus TaxID=88925 RepID=UPI00315CFBCC
MSGGLLEDFKELTSSAIPSQKGRRHDSHTLKAPKDPSAKGSPLKSLLNFGKKKILKTEKKEEKKDKHELQIDDFVVPPDQTVDEESEEWQAFQQLLARSKATVEVTKSNISKLEKTTSIGEGATIDVPKPSGASWEAFDADEDSSQTRTISPPIKSVTPPDISFDEEPELNTGLIDTSIDTSSQLAALKVSPVPSPAHQPIPPHNSRRESIDVDRNMEDDGIEELNLELQTVPCPAPDVDSAADADIDSTADLLGLSAASTSSPPEYKKSRSSSVNEDLLANLGLENLSPSGDVYDGIFSGQSSGVTTPVHRDYDVYHVPGGSEFANQLVDDFLGVSAEPPPPVAEQQDILDKIASLVPKKSDGSSKTSDPFDFGFGDVGSTNNNMNNGVLLGGVTNTVSDTDDFLGLGIETSNKTDNVDSSMTTSAHNPFLVDNAVPSNNTGFADSTLDDFFGVPAKTSPAISANEMTDESSFEPESDKGTPEEDFFDPRAAAGHDVNVAPVNGEVDVWAEHDSAPAQGGLEFEVNFNDQVDAPAESVSEVTKEDGNLFADTNKNVFPDIDINDVFANTQNDAFFTQVDEAGMNNPFLTGDMQTDVSAAFSTKNPFVDHVDALVESQQQPDFDAVFGEELEMPNFESVCALKAVGSSNEYEEPPKNTERLDVFDPFQTIHPTSGDEHEHAAGAVSDGDDDADEPTRAIQAFRISDPAKHSGTENASPAPALPPPPKTQIDAPPRFNPFDKPDSSSSDEEGPSFPKPSGEEEKSGPPARPPPPVILTKVPVRTPSPEIWIPEELPVFHEPFEGAGWHLMIRQPAKKKITSNRYWKKVWVKMAKTESTLLITCWEDELEKYKIQELTVQPVYTISEESLQQFDQYGKIHTFKIQYVFYKERVGIRPDRITPQNIQNLVKHKPKPGMILDHAPQISELMKFGSLDQEVLRSFMHEIEDSLMKLVAHRDKTLSYAKDEVSVEVWDEYQALVDFEGHVTFQKARVRLFVLAFVTGMPACELGINDKRRDGLEVVGRHDIIPLKTEDWIRIQDCEFHSTVDLAEFEKSNTIRFHPLDACQVELVRFRIPLRENKELPLQLRMKFTVTKAKESKVDIRGDVMIPGYYSSEDGQVPCEDIQIRIPIPETWIYFFRVERRFGYGSVHAAKRKPGKIKGLERITMMAQGFAPPSLIEVDVGTAKYEHVYRSIVWRIPRLPDRNHGAYKTHLFSCHLDLGPHDEIPETYAQYCKVEYTMPGSTVSKCAVRSISCENPTPPEKWVRYIAKYDYQVEMDNILKEDPEEGAVAENKEPAIEQDYAI